MEIDLLKQQPRFAHIAFKGLLIEIGLERRGDKLVILDDGLAEFFQHIYPEIDPAGHAGTEKVLLGFYDLVYIHGAFRLSIKQNWNNSISILPYRG